MSKGTLLHQDERDMMHALAIRLGGVVSQIADIARQTGGDVDRSADYLNAQEMRIALDKIKKCDNGAFVHTLAAKP